MEQIKNKITQLAEKYYNDTLQIREHLHKHPELSYNEFETSKFIKSQLDKLGITYKDGYVKTGIVGKLEGKNPGKKVIALRADMDALPIIEQNTIHYKSINEGVMHACGHDVHTASLLGTAHILHDLKDEFEGTVLLVFQPAEEVIPGGAKLMLEEGALSDPKPDMIIGQHVMPGLEVGKVGFRPGMYMASADEIYLTVKGKGGHAAMPHQITDTVLMASQIIVSLQQIVSRNAPSYIPSVLSFGKVEAKGATNIIPQEVNIAGTFRTMNEEWRSQAHSRIKEIAISVAESMGGTCDVDIKVGYPYLINNEEITTKAKTYASAILGNDNVEHLDLRMTAEDFAYFSQQLPSTFYRLGVTSSNGENNHPLHSSMFNIDNQALKTGIKTMSWLAFNFLSNF
ncbi:MAG: M20 family metallopeptidase [Bacteroidales bacterium]|nr:M20 family metallopeptidase [Bacteroidales bacterium]